MSKSIQGQAEPRPVAIDPRGPRFNQTVLAVVLVFGFAAGVWPVAPVMGVFLGLGAWIRPTLNPTLFIYRTLMSPRLGPPSHLEDPRPPRFAARLGAAFLALSTVAFLAHMTAVGWGLTLLVATLATLAATTGICVGCELYLLLPGRPRTANKTS